MWSQYQGYIPVDLKWQLHYCFMANYTVIDVLQELTGYLLFPMNISGRY